MGKKLKAGIVGVGIIGNKHARALREEKCVEIVALTDLLFDRAKELGNKISATPYKTVEEMLENEELDIAVIATPDPFHKEPFLSAVDAGVKSIICEKPLATTTEDAIEMVEAADENGTRVFVNFENRFTTMSMATRYVIQQGMIGRPIYGEIKLDDNISVPINLWGDRSVEWASMSSTAHFLLSHVSDLLRWYLEPAEVEAVYAITQREVLEYTPDLYDAFLFWDNGVKTRIKAEWIKHIDQLVEFYTCLGGETGGIVSHRHPEYNTQIGWSANLDKDLSFDEISNAQKKLNRLFYKVSQTQEGLFTPDIEVTAQQKPDATQEEGGVRGALEIRENERLHGDHFYVKSILEDTDVPSSWHLGKLPTGKDGLEAVKIVNAIIKSAQNGKQEQV